MTRFFLFYFLFIPLLTFSQVGINTTTPSPASILDVNSSSDGVNFGGFLPPRVSLSERNLIPVTALDDGLMVFLIEGTTRCVQIYDGVDAAWEDVFCMPVNQAPVANSVMFTGVLEENETLTASFAYSDAEGDSAGTHIYTWFKADDALGTNQTQIQTGTVNTYSLTNSEVNFFIAVEVTPVATSGTSPGISVLSVFEGPVLAPSTGGVFISEIADPDNNASARFVEITNGSANPIDISDWELFIFFNASTSSAGGYTIPNPTILAGGDSYVIASSGAIFLAVYGFSADAVGFNINSNGDDNFELRDGSGVLMDIYGEVGTDQTGTCADFENGRTLRISSVNEGVTTWLESEWIVRSDSTIGGCTDNANSPQNAPADFSPGTHPN